MTDVSPITDTVVQAVTPVVADLGLELYDVEITGSGRARIVRVMIDRPASGEAGERPGIDLDAIAAATEAVSPVLDRPPVDRVLSGPYALEVSSPGLERPLRTAAHFAGAVGETVSVKTRTEGHSTRVRGVVRSAGAESFTLLTDTGDGADDDTGAEQTIAYAEVVQARTVFEWDKESKRSPKSAKQAGGKGPKQGAKDRQKETVRR